MSTFIVDNIFLSTIYIFHSEIKLFLRNQYYIVILYAGHIKKILLLTNIIEASFTYKLFDLSKQLLIYILLYNFIL